MANKKDQAKEIIHSAASIAASGAAASGLLPAAGAADIPLLLAIHTKMIYEIAQLFDVAATKEMVATILDLAANTRTGIIGTKWLFSWLPVVGGLINGGISAMHTESVGWAAYKYFEENH